MTAPTPTPGAVLDAESVARHDFCDRFVAEMMTAAPIYGGTPEELRSYAEQVAPAYYAEDWQRDMGPEECAQSDIGYWED